MRTGKLVVTLGLVSAIAAGCGGGGGDSSSATTAAATSSATESTPTETTAAATAETATTETTAESSGGKASPNSKTRPDTDDDGSPDVVTFRGKPGDSFVLVGQPGYKKPSKEAAKVTVLGLTGPISGFDTGPTTKLIGVKVRFKGVGEKVFDDPQPGGQLTVTGGESGKQTSLISGSAKNPCDNPSLKLHKGQTANVCIAYEIPKSAKPKVFEYGASSGYGDTGIWRFRP